MNLRCYAALVPEPIRAPQPHAGEDGKDIRVTIRNMVDATRIHVEVPFPTR